MNLRVFLAIISVFAFQSSCNPQPTTSKLLEQFYNFIIQSNEKYAEHIKAVLEEFNSYYDQLESYEDCKIWNFDFQYDPFLDKNSLREIKYDPEIQRYVQHLKKVHEKKANEIFEKRTAYAKANKGTKVLKVLKRFDKENPRLLKTYSILTTIISFFEISLTDMAATFAKNNPKIVAGSGILFTSALGIFLGCREVNNSLNTIIAEAFKNLTIS